MKAYFRINDVEVIQSKSGKTFTIHQNGRATAEKGTDFAALCARAVELAMAVPRVTAKKAKPARKGVDL